MSVSPVWWFLPLWRIPSRYDIPGKGRVGTGNDNDFCWRLGLGGFELANVSDRLRLAPDSATHGTVQPAEWMRLEEYQEVLAETRDCWTQEPQI